MLKNDTTLSRPPLSQHNFPVPWDAKFSTKTSYYWMDTQLIKKIDTEGPTHNEEEEEEDNN